MAGFVVYALPAVRDVSAVLARQQEQQQRRDADEAERERLIDVARRRVVNDQAAAVVMQERLLKLQAENVRLAEQLNAALKEKH